MLEQARLAWSVCTEGQRAGGTGGGQPGGRGAAMRCCLPETARLRVDRVGARRQRRCMRVQVCREDQDIRGLRVEERLGERRKGASSVCHVKIWRPFGAERGREGSNWARRRGGGLEHLLWALQGCHAGPFKGVISFNPHRTPASDSGPHFIDKALRGGH